MLMQILGGGGGQTKSIMVFSEVAYLDCRKLLHCEFQKFWVIALYLEGGQITTRKF